MTNDELLFSDEEPSNKAAAEQKTWKVLIVDDEIEVHSMTKLILKNITFEDRKIDLHSAYTGKEACDFITTNTDTALILLDVVMESEHSGLEVARFIRQKLKNSMVRIVLRTGQPGQAPEKSVITEYDINDYKEKTELTAQKFYTTVISALRSFRDLNIIEQNRRGLQQIIEASKDLFTAHSINELAKGILIQLASILSVDEAILCSNLSAFAATKEPDTLKIIAGAGKFETYDQKQPDELPQNIQEKVRKVLKDKSSEFNPGEYISYFSPKDGRENILYLKGDFILNDFDINLLTIFSSNIAIAMENIYLNQKILEHHKEKIEMQQSVLQRLNKVIGLRSKETVNHVNRVAEYSYLLALKAGMSESDAEMLRIVSPMHDIGKIGIPDAILLKPGKLDDNEFSEMQKHTSIGEEMLTDGNSQLLEMASKVAGLHHEKWNGSGYPHGLSKEQIPLVSQITAICDVFDALSTKRCYKEEWPIKKVVNEMNQLKGSHFNPELVDLFLSEMDQILNLKAKYSD